VREREREKGERKERETEKDRERERHFCTSLQHCAKFEKVLYPDKVVTSLT
jgi:hypothetical protein